MSVTEIGRGRSGAADDEIVEDGAASHEGDEVVDAKSIEDRAADGEHEQEEDDGTQQLVLAGTGTTGGKLSSSVGGKRPTESLFKMSGVALPIAGALQLEKDTELWIAVPVAIDDVGLKNRRKNGEIVAVARVHIARAIGQPVVLDGPPEGFGD